MHIIDCRKKALCFNYPFNIPSIISSIIPKGGVYLMAQLCRLAGVLLFLAAGFVMAPALAAQEEDEQNPAQLDALSVYATLTARRSFEVPALASILYPAYAANALAGDMAGLLQFSAGVEVDEGPRRNGQLISLRGFDDEAVVTLVDGRRQNFESQHDGRFFLDPALIHSIEIVKGASSAIYGGGAVGGVVAFRTPDAANLLAAGEEQGTSVSLGYRSGNDEYAPSLVHYRYADGVDMLTSFSLRRSGDINQGGGGTLYADDQLVSGLLKLKYTLAGGNTMALHYQLSNNDGSEPNTGSLPVNFRGGRNSNPVVDKEVRDQQISLHYQTGRPVSRWFHPRGQMYFNRTEVQEEDLITGSTNDGRRQNRTLTTLGLSIASHSELAFNEGIKHRLSYGVEFYRDEQQGGNSLAQDGRNGRAPNAEANTYGIYVQDEISLIGKSGILLLIPALRYDSYASKNEDESLQRDEDALSPKLSFSFQPSERAVFFASWARAFRAPNMTELYPYGQHFRAISIPGSPVGIPENLFVDSSDLQPEIVETLEIGLGGDFDDLLAGGDRLTFKTAWFLSEGKDFITQNVDIAFPPSGPPRNGTTKNENIPNARLAGFELGGEYRLYPFGVRLGLAYVEAENKDTGEYLPNNVPLTLTSDISWEFARWHSLVGWRARLAAESDKAPDDEHNIDELQPNPGYSVHDIYYRWRRHGGRLALDLGVENLFDKAYARRFAFLPEEGRSFSARISYQW